MGYFSPDNIIWTLPALSTLQVRADPKILVVLTDLGVQQKFLQKKKITKNHIVISLPKHSADIF